MRPAVQLVREMTEEELANLVRVVLGQHFEVSSTFRHDKWPPAKPSHMAYDFNLPTDDAQNYVAMLARRVAERLGLRRRQSRRVSDRLRR